MILEVAGFLSNAFLLDKDLHKEESTVVRNLNKERQLALASGFGTFNLAEIKTQRSNFRQLTTGDSVKLKLHSEFDQISVEYNGKEIGIVSESYYRLSELKGALEAGNDIDVKCIRKDLVVAGTVSFSFEVK
ncbi:hypothetical protein EV198_1124 [Roseivirga ehrenbergii]|uniref:Uncharacterized protein n=1 Tax=Roseivirga ehrenbergii (strain DSM 102268 / JCM 13514 / KCTC 12282 / NCIMB 14502 / KMM 6017) TaxID=279360 RepID=A0A150X6V4_ROSEK|nr:hypothetical protein [Roseivirga ehrenbergii]KYG74414.1 hypothetical protein MB14_04165 [Roseivirga ehrenbergii]TCL14284.1 hypothetical protein EV198_1124 [Roseivirga ehrenbergii]